MATITIDPAALLPSEDAERIASTDAAPTTCYEAVTAGKLAYEQAVGVYGLADANGADDAMHTCVGMFENSTSAAGQFVSIIKKDPALKIAASGLTPGKVLIPGNDAGELVEYGDQATGWHVQPVALVMSATTVNFELFPVCSPAIA